MGHHGTEELRHVLVVGQQLLGVLGQAVAAVAEAGVVVVRSDARLTRVVQNFELSFSSQMILNKF